MSIFQVPPRRDIQLKFMVSQEEKALIEAAAKRHKLTVSDLLRVAANEYVAKLDKKKK